MASSQSQIDTYDNLNLFRQENIELLAQDLTLKQGIVDANKERLIALQERIGVNLDIAREEDNQYLYGRLTQATNIINQHLRRGADLSSVATGDSLFRQLKEVVNDENILTAVKSTKKMRQDIALIEYKKANEPDKYNRRNEAVALKGVNEYLSAEGVGVTYNSRGYTDYVDFDKIFTSKEFTNYLKNTGLVNEEWIEEIEAGGYTNMVVKYKGSPDLARLQSAVQTFIGEAGRDQLRVDAEYYFGDGSQQDGIDLLQSKYESERLSQIESLKGSIKAAEDRVKILTGDDKTQLQEKIDEGKRSLAELEKNTFSSLVVKDGVIDSRAFLGLGENLLYKDTVSKYTGLSFQSPLVQDIDVNKYQYKQRKLEIDLQRLEIAQSAENRAIAKANREAQEQQEASGLVTRYAEDVMTFEEDQDLLAFQQQIYTDAISGLAASVIGVEELNQGQVLALFNVLENDENWLEKTSIVAGGVTYDLTDETVVQSLQKFKNAYEGNNRVLKEVKQRSIELNDAVLEDLIQNVDSYERKLTFAEGIGIYMEGGQYKVKEMSANELIDLLKKAKNEGFDSLEDVEKTTLKVNASPYASGIMKGVETRKILRTAIQEDILGLLGNEGYEVLNEVNNFYESSKTDTNLGVIATAISSMVSPTVTTEDDRSIKGVLSGKIENELSKTFNESIENILQTTNQAQSRQTYVPPEHPSYQTLKRRGVFGEGYKDGILLKPVYDEKERRIVGYNLLKATAVSIKDGQETVKVTDWQPIKTADANSNLPLIVPTNLLINDGINLSKNEQTAYETTLRNAAEFSLGRSVVNGAGSIAMVGDGSDNSFVGEIKQRLENKKTGGLTERGIERVNETLSWIDKMVDAYDSGVTFVGKRPSVGAPYGIYMQTEDEEYLLHDFGMGTLQEEDVFELQRMYSNESARRNLFLNFLNNQVNVD